MLSHTLLHDVARQFTDFGRLEAAYLTYCLCDVIASVRDVLFGIFTHSLLTPFMNSLNVCHQNKWSTEFHVAFRALVIPYVFMHLFHMPNENCFVAAFKITFFTFLVPNTQVYGLYMLTQICLFTCSMIAHGTFKISSFFVHHLYMLAYIRSVLRLVITIWAWEVCVLWHAVTDSLLTAASSNDIFLHSALRLSFLL